MATEEKLREYLKRVTIDLTHARHRIAELEDGRYEPVAVIGMACRFPGGGTVEDFWELLRDGRSSVTEVPRSRWNIEDYYNPDRRAFGGVYTSRGAFLPDIAGWDADFFGVSPQEALRMDPHQRLLMELVWDGLEDAGTSPARVAGSRTAVLVGLMDSLQYARLEAERQGSGVTADPYFGQGISTSVVAGRLAYHFDLHGPAVTLDTACSSSLVGLHLAAQALRRGECDLAVAAGAYLIMQPDTYIQACATSMLAPDGLCKTFDAAADGYVMGEGGGVVVLERLSSAVRNGRRVRAVLRGSAINSDGRSNGLIAPSRGAQADVIRRALAEARVEPGDVDYVEAHGSGTGLGDAIELSALHDVFGGRSPRRPLLVGAVKTNIGHTQSAAGVAGLIKTVLLLEHGVVPPTLNLAQPSDALPADGTIQPVTVLAPLPADGPAIAGISSFGWSGTNAHLVIEAAPARAESPAQQEAQPSAAWTLPVSAASGAALSEQLGRLADWLGERPGLALADIAHTLTVGRAEHDCRRAVTCTSVGDAAQQLARAATKAPTGRPTGRPRVVFLLPGIGDHYQGMGLDLYRSEPVYAGAVDRCIAVLDERCNLDLRPMFFPAGGVAAAGGPAAGLWRGQAEPGTDPMDMAQVAHPFQFTVEYALAQLLSSWGVVADVLVGYSLGEYVAACLAGVFTLEDALLVVAERAALIAAVPSGRMLAVAAGEGAIRGAMTAGDIDVEIAALNGPAMTVLSGAAEEIAAMTARLTDAGIACRELRTAHAFHSSLLEPVRDKLAALLESVPRQGPATTIVSNHSGAALTAEQATSSGYWADHLVSPVRFGQGVRHCVAQGADVFVELGAGQTLGGLARQNLAGATGVSVFGTLPTIWTGGTPSDARTALLMTCARLWETGVGVDWAATTAGSGRIVTLPGYPFQRTRYWPEPGESASSEEALPARPPADLRYAPAWRRDVVNPPGPALALDGPLVVFADRQGIGAALADRAVASGIDVIEVAAGTQLRRDGRRMVIDPAAPEHYREIFAAVDAPGPVHIVHLWGLLATSANPVYAADDELRDAVSCGFGSLLLAVRALGELPARRGVRLLTASAGAAEIIGADVTAPLMAAAHGLGRVVQHEVAGLRWSGVDLDPTLAEPEQAAGQLACELMRSAAEPCPAVAGWRRGCRWTADWTQVPTPDDQQPVWRADGVYLITGGTRGLGMALARHLVRSGVRRLALMSRTPERGRGDVSDLEASGAQVLLLAADAGVPDQLRAALQACRRHFGALHGVVHAAGLPGGGMAQRRSLGDAEAVLAPKILAMGPLTELVGPGTPAELRLELLVLYSSAITAFGGIGEGDYCAANTVLDAYGAALAGSAPATRVLTVAWGPWLHDDWQAAGLAGAGSAGDGLARRVRAHREKYGFSDEAGCAFLDRMIRTGHGSLLAVRQPVRDSLREWSAILDLDALVGAVSALPSGERFSRPQLRTEFVAPRTERERMIADVWGSFLGIDQVGIHDPFFDLGGNSLVGMAVVYAIERDLDIAIAPATLFGHPTIAEFATALEDKDASAESAKDLLAASADRGRRRRGARPAKQR